VVVARVERLVSSGTFSLDGQTWQVDNNVWLVGDDDEVVVVDPAHDGPAVLAAVDGRTVLAVVCTHGHDDHIRSAGEVAEATGAPILLHPDDGMLWDVVHPDRTPSQLADDDLVEVADTGLRVLHTPGHSPGAVSLHVPSLGVVLTGDTLFRGGPGATGRSYSDFGSILTSIRTRLLTLPPQTTVLTGHGDDTSIGAEAADYDAWVARGY
jgi:glyoxylase-like metal-dependent hydrolase (beta-lactamase superfamily II)